MTLVLRHLPHPRHLSIFLSRFHPKQQSNWRVIASAVETNGIDLVPFGRSEHVAGVKLGGKGDTTKTNRLWTLKVVGNDSCTPVHRTTAHVRRTMEEDLRHLVRSEGLNFD